MELIYCQQSGDEWFAAKLGMVTSSRFSDVLNKKTGRGLYMRKVAGERLSGIREETYSNANMEAGIELEASARQYYEKLNNCTVEQVGFIKRDDWVGSSPDGLVGTDGQIEIKCVIPSTQINTILKGKIPSEHIRQIQGQLFVSERKWCDFISFCPLLKMRPFFCIRIFRDEEYIENLAIDMEVFIGQLKDMINQITLNRF